jgi:hypothetical protein
MLNMLPDFSCVFQINRDYGIKAYEINVHQLPKDRCHMFFSIWSFEQLLLITALEGLSFSTNMKALYEGMIVEPIKLGKDEIYYCSFPQNYKEVCEKIAQIYAMKINPGKQLIKIPAESGKEFTILMPGNENFLFYKKTQYIPVDQIKAECKMISTLEIPPKSSSIKPAIDPTELFLQSLKRIRVQAHLDYGLRVFKRRSQMIERRQKLGYTKN